MSFTGEGWVSVGWPGGERHVMPVGDYRPHTLSRGCWWRPDEDVPGSSLWVHNAMDRREAVENGEVRLS